MTPMQIDFGNNAPERVIGIDLGTTNSLVAYMDLTAPKVIPGADGDRLVPSVVSLTRSGEIVVGKAARTLLINEPDRTIYSVKRLMGRGVADVQDENLESLVTLAKHARHIGRRPRQPIDHIFKDARNGIVVLRRHQQQRVGGDDLFLERQHRRWHAGGLDVGVV